MIDLTQLAYPRHVHHPDGRAQIARTAADAGRALGDGWQLLPPGAEYAVPGAVEIPDAPKKRGKP